MQIVEKYISELKPYMKNPRDNKPAVEYVANSIEKFGFKVPMVIDADNVIVCGHTRYLAAKKLGIDKVPCVIADDLTPKQIKAFRLADNKVSEFATWDFELLDTELLDLQELELDFDMSDFGFSAKGSVDWDNIDDLTEEAYQKPEKTMLLCPKCGHIDSNVHFKKVER